MAPYKNSRGVAMAMTIMILLFLLPLLLTFVKRTQILNRLTARERMTKTSRALAVNAVTDYMRQFSNDYYIDHMDPEVLDRGQEVFYSAGFTTVTVIPDNPTRTVFISAEGKYGQNSDNPLQTKRLKAVVKFVSDVTKYGTVFRDTATGGNGRRTYNGGYALRNGRIDLTATAGTVSSFSFVGPTIIGTDLNYEGPGVTHVNVVGDLYIGGNVNLTGPCNPNPCTFQHTNGRRSAQLPRVTPPSLAQKNIDYFKGHCSYSTGTLTTGTFQDWTFNTNGTMDIRNVPGGAITSTINLLAKPRGAILVAENARIFMRGRIRGHVTVVVTSTWTAAESMGLAGVTVDGTGYATAQAPSATVIPGVVKLEDTIIYISSSGTPTLLANQESSLAVLASNYILWEKTNTLADDMGAAPFWPGTSAATPGYHKPGWHMAGVYFVENQPNEGSRIKPYLRGGGTPAAQASNIILSGVRATAFQSNGIAPTPYVTVGPGAGEFATMYDPNLLNYPPPGLPEAPVLQKLEFD